MEIWTNFGQFSNPVLTTKICFVLSHWRLNVTYTLFWGLIFMKIGQIGEKWGWLVKHLFFIYIVSKNVGLFSIGIMAIFLFLFAADYRFLFNTIKGEKHIFWHQNFIIVHTFWKYSTSEEPELKWGICKKRNWDIVLTITFFVSLVADSHASCQVVHCWLLQFQICNFSCTLLKFFEKRSKDQLQSDTIVLALKIPN